MPGADAGDATTGGPFTPHEIVDRPPPGLAQGRYEWPSWGIATLGSVVVILGVAFVVWRLRRPGTR